MKDITVTARDGKQSKLETIYIRGSMIRFIVVPDMLQQAPMFKRVGPNAMKGRGIGSARGRATIMRGKFTKALRSLSLSFQRDAYFFHIFFSYSSKQKRQRRRCTSTTTSRCTTLKSESTNLNIVYQHDKKEKLCTLEKEESEQ